MNKFTFKNILMVVLVSLAIAVLAVATPAWAQDPTITGKVVIDYPSRTPEGKILKDTNDVYKVDSVISDKGKPVVGFKGTILNLPTIRGFRGQQGNLAFDLVVYAYKTPTNPIRMGKLTGTVPIDAKNVYHFNKGKVKMTMDTTPSFKGFENIFTGTALGRPPKEGSIQSFKKDILRFWKKATDGSWVQSVVDNYDQMVFQNVLLGGGPFMPPMMNCTTDGKLVYDYGNEAWRSALVLTSAGSPPDNVTGTISWTEEDVSGGIRPGTYNFNLLFNEPQPTSDQQAALSGKAPVASDMAAFFATDVAQPSITGTFKYRDTMLTEKLPSKSEININLACNKLNLRQTVDFWKMLMLAFVPFNSE